MPLHLNKITLYECLYLQSVALSKPAGLPCLLLVGNQGNFNTRYSTHRKLSGTGTQKAGNHLASTSSGVTHIACSWPRLVQQQLPTPSPTLMLLQSLVCISKAHRQCKLWTWAQTSHMQCLLKIQRVKRTLSASPEQAGWFCTAIHLCQVLRHCQAAQLCSYPPCSLPHSNCFASASEPRKSVLDCRP